MDKSRSYTTFQCSYCGKENTRRSDSIRERNYCSVSCSRKDYLSRTPREKLPTWQGGRRITPSGYMEILKPEHHRARGNGYVFEHILVIEEKIGRPVTINEHVHHKDENKTNNHPSNLELLTPREHGMKHRKQRSGVYKKCPICGETFYTKPSHISKRVTCSLKCTKVLFNGYFLGKPRGHHLSAEEKQEAIKKCSTESS